MAVFLLEFHTDGNSVWVIFRYSRKTIGYDLTVTPQMEKVLFAVVEQTFRPKKLWV